MSNEEMKDVRYSAKISAESEAPVKYDKYNNITQTGFNRYLGKIDITADSLEQLKAKLHAHIDLLE